MQPAKGLHAAKNCHDNQIKLPTRVYLIVIDYKRLLSVVATIRGVALIHLSRVRRRTEKQHVRPWGKSAHLRGTH